MPTVRLVPNFEKKDSEGRSMIRLSVSISGKRTYHSTGKKTSKAEWDEDERLLKKSVKNSAVTNAILKRKVAAMEEKILQIELAEGKVSLHNVRSRAIRGASANFHTYSKDLVEDLKKKFAPGSIKGYGTTLGKIKEFSPTLFFSEIDPIWLRKFETFLIGKDLSTNTISSHWKRLKRIVNSAIRDGVDIKYPFIKYDNPKYRQTIRTYLTPEEITKWESALLKPITDSQYRIGNYFLLGCYSGLRISDWQRFNPGFISGDRLILYAKKNGEMVSMKIHDKLRVVIDRIVHTPLNMEDPKVNEVLKDIATIAKITKSISTHVGRHTFGTQCAERGIPISACAEFLGISERTCKTYYRITGTLLDKEIEKFNDPDASRPPV